MSDFLDDKEDGLVYALLHLDALEEEIQRAAWHNDPASKGGQQVSYTGLRLFPSAINTVRSYTREIRKGLMHCTASDTHQKEDK